MNGRIYQSVFFVFLWGFFTLFSISSQSSFTVHLGQNISEVEREAAKSGAEIRAHNQDMFLVTNLPSLVNGVSPSQLLLSLDKQKNVMIIGYFFSSMAKQEEAIRQLAPFPVPFKDGYGAAYDKEYIVNASPQSGSFLVSLIDRKMFAHNSSSEEKILVKNIDQSYFSGSRPTENSHILIMPGQRFKTVLQALAGYGAKYIKEPSGDIRATVINKTVLSAQVSEIYVVMGANERASQIYYQFREDSEGIRFASKLAAVKNNPSQLKLLKSKVRFAAVQVDDLFVLASPQDGEYKVVLMSVQATRAKSERAYQEIMKTLESAKELEKY